MSAYIGSTPTAPLDPGTVEFVKGKPSIVQAAKNNAYYIGRLKQHLADFDKDLAEWKASGEWKKDYKTWGAACNLALGMTQRWANSLIRRYNEIVSDKAGITVPVSTDSDSKETLEKVNALPDPTEEVLENGETLKDYEEAAPAKGNGKIKPKAASEPSKVVAGPPKDDLGQAIPQHCMKLVNRVEDDLQPYITAASRLSGLFSKLSDDLKHPDQLFRFAHGHLHEALDHARWLHHLLRDCKPDRVCPACDGDGGKCDTCLGTGMVSDYTWGHRITGSLSGDPKLAAKAKAIEKGK